ncbi:MAG: DUF6777 domain-containing protein [Actinomycetota bacterium]
MRFTRRGVIIGLLILVLGGGAVFGSIQLLGSEKVLYLAADEVGPDPFTEPAVFLNDVQPVVVLATPAPSPSPGASESPGFEPVPDTSATPVALKGDCDPDKLIELLNGAPERRAAWAEVLRVGSDDVEEYVVDLRSAKLSRDARVTMHGFEDSEPTEYQAILEAGSSVLVDQSGDIVVRCQCGNPIEPPRKIKYTCEGCPEDYDPPPSCNGTCFELSERVPPTTTTLIAATTTLPPAVPSTTAPGRSTAATTRRPAAATTTTRPPAANTTVPPVGQTGGTLFPPNTQTFPPAATANPNTTAPPVVTSLPPSGTQPEATTTSGCFLGLCGIF